MPLFRRKKRPLQPGEKFKPRKHIDRRTKDLALDVPPSGVSKEPTFAVTKADYQKMAESKPTIVRGGVYSRELLERREQAAKKAGLSKRIEMFFSRRFRRK